MQPGSSRTQLTGSKRALLRLQGFTLVELMVTIAVAAILLALAAPSFASLINSNRLAGQANEVVASLQLARVEAVRLNQRAVVCRSTNNTSCETTTAGQWAGWITFIDKDSDGTADVGEEVIRVNTVKAPVRVTSGVASIVFRSDGMAHDGTGLLATAITVCIPTTRPVENRRVVSIGSGSRISTAPANGAGACP